MVLTAGTASRGLTRVLVADIIIIYLQPTGEWLPTPDLKYKEFSNYIARSENLIECKIFTAGIHYSVALCWSYILTSSVRSVYHYSLISIYPSMSLCHIPNLLQSSSFYYGCGRRDWDSKDDDPRLKCACPHNRFQTTLVRINKINCF